VRNQRVLLCGLCGLVGTAIDVTLLVTLVESGVAVALAAFLGAAAGAVACYLANKRWAFRDRSPISLRQVGAFGLVAVGTALLMAAAMSVVSVGLGVPYLTAKAICAATVFLLWSYPLQRHLVFAVRGRSAAGRASPDPTADAVADRWDPARRRALPRALRRIPSLPAQVVEVDAARSMV
jgi:putative flippase GtrA